MQRRNIIVPEHMKHEDMIPENTNRSIADDKAAEQAEWGGNLVTASGTIDDAMAAMSINTPITKSAPEKRMKAAYKKYEAEQMVWLRADIPGLKRSQYKERIFKAWQKAPENPKNEVADVENGI
jgi:hypothetical protein